MTPLSAAAPSNVKTLSARTSGNRCFHWFHSGYVSSVAIGISSKDMPYNPTDADFVHTVEGGE
jgi:hypothetical protein